MERTLFRRKTISLREAGFIGYWQNKDQSPSVLIDINNFLCQFRLVSHLSVIYTNIFSLSKGITIITNQYFSVSENSQVLILRFCLRLLNSNLDSDCFPLLLCNQYPLVFISFVYLKYCRYSHFLPLSCPHLFSHQFIVLKEIDIYIFFSKYHHEQYSKENKMHSVQCDLCFLIKSKSYTVQKF